MAREHKSFHFSVTLRSDDLAVIHCLRALAQYAQRDGNTRITWGGTKRKDWEENHHQITLRFTQPEYRHHFVAEADRLLPLGSWSEASRSDSDPASPQTSGW